MKHYIQVVDNVLPTFLFDRMRQSILSEEIFRFMPNMDDSPDEYGFSCMISEKEHVYRPVFFQDCLNVLQFSCEKSNIVPGSILQSRFFLQPSFPHEPTTATHVDLDVEHIVCLFYLSNADNQTSCTKIYDNEKRLLETVEPRENRAVMFDGMLPHSAGYPKKGVRLVCNINFCRKSYVTSNEKN